MAAKIPQPIQGLNFSMVMRNSAVFRSNNLSPTPNYAISQVIMWWPCLICQTRTDHLPTFHRITLPKGVYSYRYFLHPMCILMLQLIVDCWGNISGTVFKTAPGWSRFGCCSTLFLSVRQHFLQKKSLPLIRSDGWVRMFASCQWHVHQVLGGIW